MAHKIFVFACPVMFQGIARIILGKMFSVLSRAWDKEKILSSYEESNLGPLRNRDSIWWAKLIKKFLYDTRPVYC